MNKQETFENLLNNPESSVLDFKKELYNFLNEADANAKFIKDIISFSNTIRNNSAYIIFGIKETNGILDLIGLEHGIDDSILQNKIKDNVFPRPVFSYSPIIYQEKLFGLIEIPIYKYELPIMPTKQLKGLSVGQVYYRNGSSNTEATAFDVIRINDWFRSLQGNIKNNLSEEVSKYLASTVQVGSQLSSIFADFLHIATQHNLHEIKEFIQSELGGIIIPDHDKYNYRIQKILVSFAEINASPYINVTVERLRNELTKNDSTYERNFFFQQTIIEIEKHMDDFRKNEKRICVTYKMSSKQIFDEGDYPMTAYIFENNISGVYNNIKQHFIDLLMKI